MGGAPSRTFKRRKHLSLGFHYFLVTGKKISLFWVKVHESSLLGTHEQWCAGWMGVQRLPKSNSHSGTAGAAERESNRSPAPCDSAWGGGVVIKSQQSCTSPTRKQCCVSAGAWGREPSHKTAARGPACSRLGLRALTRALSSTCHRHLCELLCFSAIICLHYPYVFFPQLFPQQFTIINF